jgi:hypothetical protein
VVVVVGGGGGERACVCVWGVLRPTTDKRRHLRAICPKLATDPCTSPELQRLPHGVLLLRGALSVHEQATALESVLACSLTAGDVHTKLAEGCPSQRYWQLAMFNWPSRCIPQAWCNTPPSRSTWHHCSCTYGGWWGGGRGNGL